jgi:hypothetical protein
MYIENAQKSVVVFKKMRFIFENPLIICEIGSKMSEFQEEYSFDCPYCASPNSILVDLTGGRQQSFTSDCEVCCRPIVVALTVEDETVVSFEAERESD